MTRQPNKAKKSGDQLLVRKLGPLKQRLRRRASQNGRSMEEEARNILRSALQHDDGKPEKGLGTRIAERFSGLGLKEEDFPRLKIELRLPKFD